MNDTITLSETTTTVTLGNPASVTLTTAGYFGSTGDTVTSTAALKTWPSALTAAQIATAITAPVFSDVDTATAYTGGSAGGSRVTNSGLTSAIGADTAPKVVSTRSKLTVTPAVVGTYTYSITPAGGANTTAITWTVLVTARPALTAAASTALAYYAYYNNDVPSRGNWAFASTTTNALTFTAYATPTNAPSMAVQVIQANGNTTSPLQAADAVAITATVTSGPGLVAISGDGNDGTIGYSAQLGAKGTYAVSTTGQIAALGLTQYVYVYTTGAPGPVTVEIKAGTTVLGTKKIQFFGNPATITSTVAKAVIGAANTAAVVTGVVTDVSSNPVPDVAVYAVSDTVAAISNSYTSCGTTDALGAYSCSVTGVAAGTAKITTTLNSSATGTSAVTATPVSVRVSDGVPTKVDYAFAATTYAPGAAASITATVSNAAGVMPAGTYTVLTAGVTGNYVLSGAPTTTVTTTDATGVVKYAVTVPVGISGPLTLTGTAVSTVTATFGQTEVVNAALDAANAATDAAIEAGDNANNAKDAADQAIEAADLATQAALEAGELAVTAAQAAGEIASEAKAAALDAVEAAEAATTAVAALSAAVAKLIADLNLRITKLGNKLNSILKKL
jgi:protocatechuate 3,4-dioxygenase beta subunit